MVGVAEGPPLLPGHPRGGTPDPLAPPSEAPFRCPSPPVRQLRWADGKAVQLVPGVLTPVSSFVVCITESNAPVFIGGVVHGFFQRDNVMGRKSSRFQDTTLKTQPAQEQISLVHSLPGLLPGVGVPEALCPGILPVWLWFSRTGKTKRVHLSAPLAGLKHDNHTPQNSDGNNLPHYFGSGVSILNP